MPTPTPNPSSHIAIVQHLNLPGAGHFADRLRQQVFVLLPQLTHQCLQAHFLTRQCQQNLAALVNVGVGWSRVFFLRRRQLSQTPQA